jgi:hypothetical protein
MRACTSASRFLLIKGNQWLSSAEQLNEAGISAGSSVAFCLQRAINGTQVPRSRVESGCGLSFTYCTFLTSSQGESPFRIKAVPIIIKNAPVKIDK